MVNLVVVVVVVGEVVVVVVVVVVLVDEFVLNLMKLIKMTAIKSKFKPNLNNNSLERIKIDQVNNKIKLFIKLSSQLINIIIL
jgi:hypothetical protein